MSVILIQVVVPRFNTNALYPSCMCSTVVTVSPFAHEAASFVVCLGPAVRLAGRFVEHCFCSEIILV